MDEFEFLSKTSGEPGVIQSECYFIGLNYTENLLDQQKSDLRLGMQLYVTRGYGIHGYILGRFIEDTDRVILSSDEIIFIDDPEKLDEYDKALEEGKIRKLRKVNLLEDVVNELRYYGEIYREGSEGLHKVINRLNRLK